jgi:hypothetical protein
VIEQNADRIILPHGLSLLTIGSERIKRAAAESKTERHHKWSITKNISQPPDLGVLDHIANINFRHFLDYHGKRPSFS